MKNVKKAQPSPIAGEWHTAIHPGEIIRRRFFAPLGLSQASFCAKFGIEEAKFSRVLAGRQKITPSTAKVLSEAFRMSPMFFLNLQSQHDLANVGKKSGG